MVTNAQRIERLQAQLEKVKAERDGYRARLNKHIEAARKRREGVAKKKRTDAKNAKLKERRTPASPVSPELQTMRNKMWKTTIAPRWTTNVAGDDARDELGFDLTIAAAELVTLLGELEMDALARHITELMTNYDADVCDAEDDWAFYDEIKKALETAEGRGKFA